MLMCVGVLMRCQIPELILTFCFCSFFSCCSGRAIQTNFHPKLSARFARGTIGVRSWSIISTVSPINTSIHPHIKPSTHQIYQRISTPIHQSVHTSYQQHTQGFFPHRVFLPIFFFFFSRNGRKLYFGWLKIFWSQRVDKYETELWTAEDIRQP